jgi:hypothetical protein
MGIPENFASLHITIWKMPNPWLNEHKSMAALNFFLNKDALKK